ncbi:MAG: Trm112 family protein [bacterium]
MALDRKLQEILVCPKTKEPLIYFEEDNFLFSPSAKLKYPIDDGIPVMLVDEAEELSDEEAGELLDEAQNRGLEHADQTLGND